MIYAEIVFKGFFLDNIMIGKALAGMGSTLAAMMREY